MTDEFNTEVLNQLHPQKVRELIRAGRIRQPTIGISGGFTQGKVVMIPKEFAYDFLLYTQRNQRTLPVLEVSEPGSREFTLSAKGSDIARDMTRYCVYKNGVLKGELESIAAYWRDDLVSFLLGSSYSFESILTYAGITLRHVGDAYIPPMFITNLETVPSGKFGGPLVVSMRPIRRDQLVKVIKITSLLPEANGAPIHIGDPSLIGIKDIHSPDFGDPVSIGPNEVPVFWASSATARVALIKAKIHFLVTQPAGHMFITDLRNIEQGGTEADTF